MKVHGLILPALIGAVSSARAMTPMATIGAARLLGRRSPGRLVLLDRAVFALGALAMGVGELFADKMKSAPDRTAFLGLWARVMSAGIAGAALAPRGRELAGRERAMARFGQTRSGLIEDALMVAAGMTIVALAVGPRNGW